MNHEILDDQFHKHKKKVAPSDKQELEEQIRQFRTKIREGRLALFVALTLALFTLYAAFSLPEFSESRNTAIIEASLMSLIYLFCFLFSQKEPVKGMAVGLVVFILFILYYALILPNTIYDALIARLMVIFFIIRGITAAQKLRHLQKLHHLGGRY